MTLTRHTSIPIEGVECVVVDGSVTRIHLPGGFEVSSPYASLTITGPKLVKLELSPPPAAPDDIGF